MVLKRRKTGMKHLIVCSIVLLSIIFLITPSIPAIEFSLVRHANEKYYETELLDEFFPISLKNFKSDTIESYQSISTYTHLFENILDAFSSQNVIPKLDNENNEPHSQGLIIIGILFYGIILYIMFKIVLFILRDIGSIVRNFLYKLSSPLRNLLRGIATLIVYSFSILFKIFMGTTQILAQGLVLLGQALIFIILSIIKLIQFGWQALGTFFMLIIQIFQLIIRTIFPVNSVIY